MARDSVIGVREVQRLFEEVGRAPAKVLTKAVKKSATIVLKAARVNAPVDQGDLKKGIRLKAERRRQGRRVYQVGVFGKSGGGEEFVKISRSGKRSYYPASQEYGWTDQYGHYHPGYRYLRNAADRNTRRVHSMMLEIMAEELDKLR
ncbi:MAG: HK97 gp10 family phage protein [Desulfitobacteriaceae bacterium]